MMVRRLSMATRTIVWRTALATAAIVAEARWSSYAAAEPNETFATATVLSPGVLVVSDALTPGYSNEPDTLLGTRNSLGDIDVVDDDSSTLGNGTASGVFGVPIPFGSIAFAVTGRPNFSFDGLHDENGRYEVFVDVYDENEELLETLTASRLLAVDAVDEFSFSNVAWVNGSYDVNIDNVIPDGGDVDFFRFTGLTAGASFTAETLAALTSDIDTFLGWFDASGTLIASDDDGAGGSLSKLVGVVPAGGALTFAVTGYGDDSFLGQHFENDSYQLKLTLGGGTFSADFDRSGGVRGADLALWKSNFRGGGAGDADGDGDTDGHDFLLWQRQLGSGAGAAASVPEPGGALLAAMGLTLLSLGKRRGFAVAIGATGVC